MKSPAELSSKLTRQWQSADMRELLLLGNSDWPVCLTIGKPGAALIKNSSALVREHLQRWRSEKTGRVEWSSVKYQAAGSAVDIPLYWCMQTVEEWVTACHDKLVSSEYYFLSEVLAKVDRQFHALIVRQRSLWKNISIEQLVQCCELAMQLEPGCAQGRPLRALTITNIDSKFIENNRLLLIKLLNQRFNQALQQSSLEDFLGAAENNDHWLLVIGLSDGLLPFQQLRLRASELATIELPASHILIVENEQCRYQLPRLENSIAILGAGLNLGWLANRFFKTTQLAYWGDIDSWGLKMLGIARNFQPALTPLLMDDESFENNQQFAVNEVQTAGTPVPEGLTDSEGCLYEKILGLTKGRLEQEFINRKQVERVIKNWYLATT